MSKEAMKLALEALESCDAAHITDGGHQWYDEKLVDTAYAALRSALAEQPAQKCSYPYCGCNSKAWCKVERNEALDKKAENARELGLDYEPAQQEPVLQDIEQYRLQMAGISTAAIGYWKESDGIHPDYDTIALRDVAKLYAKYDELYRAQRTWVDLTDDEIKKEFHPLHATGLQFARAVLAKSKEKNT